LLNLKKLLTKISNALYVGNTEYTPTYTSNSYFSETAVNRIRLFRTGPRSGLVRINLTNDVAAIPSSDTTEHEIASFSGVSFARDAYLVLPSQSVGANASTLYVFCTGNKIKIANFSGANVIKNTFFRLTVPVVLNLDTGG
jgi:hypothetical protein